jgi:voltage-gated potassium channel
MVVRAGAALGFDAQVIKRLASHRGTKFVLAALLVILVLGAGGALLAERHADGSNIQSYGDSLWWAIGTMTSGGYGDYYPTTPAGRGIAVALMLFGIAALSVFTASVAAFLVREPDRLNMADLMQKLEMIEAQLNELGARTADSSRPVPPA